MTKFAKIKNRWGHSLTLQTASLMLLCLVAAQWMSIWAFCDERAAMLRVVATESLARELSLLSAAPHGTPFPAREGVHVWTTEDRLETLSEAPSAAIAAFEDDTKRVPFAVWASDAGQPLQWQVGPEGVSLAEAGFRAAILALPTADGHWINASIAMPDWTDPWAQQNWSALLFTSLALILAAIAISHRVIRPMRALAAAADTFAGAQAHPIAIHGPGEIGRTVAAFNAMQDRISTLVRERTRMLSALGHDLRTPMTRLRLRAHLIDDPDVQAPVLRDLGEIEGLTERALDLAREATGEPMVETDIPDLIRSLTNDLHEAGIHLKIGGFEPVRADVQRDGLRHAIANLAENAHRYAGGGTVHVRTDTDSFAIVVSDHGPGIPEESLEDVMQPFVRLERSRSRHTGGSGLGLALARSTAEAHGGKLLLRNGMSGGLTATISIPFSGASQES